MSTELLPLFNCYKLFLAQIKNYVTEIKILGEIVAFQEVVMKSGVLRKTPSSTKEINIDNFIQN